MVVPVPLFELLHRHAEEARSIPQIDAVLHQPGRACMPQNVRRDVTAQPGGLDGRLKAFAHALDGLPVPLDHEPSGDAADAASGACVRVIVAGSLPAAGAFSSARGQLSGDRTRPAQDRRGHAL